MFKCSRIIHSFIWDCFWSSPFNVFTFTISDLGLLSLLHPHFPPFMPTCVCICVLTCNFLYGINCAQKGFRMKADIYMHHIKHFKNILSIYICIYIYIYIYIYNSMLSKRCRTQKYVSMSISNTLHTLNYCIWRKTCDHFVIYIFDVHQNWQKILLWKRDGILSTYSCSLNHLSHDLVDIATHL